MQALTTLLFVSVHRYLNSVLEFRIRPFLKKISTRKSKEKPRQKFFVFFVVYFFILGFI